MATVNITIANDADFYRTFIWRTLAGSPIDLTGGVMEMMLRRHAKDEASRAAARQRHGRDRVY
ncbi:hypothetical protein ACVWXQ_003070 [Bradyrhizobium sp. S3.14.4]